MHTGKKLGDAIRVAIELKMTRHGIKKIDIAKAFDIKEPSVHDWINKGSIDKEKLPALWKYFSDVVGMEHWGFTDSDFYCFGLTRNHVRDGADSAYNITPLPAKANPLLEQLVATASQLSPAGLERLVGYADGLLGQYPQAKQNLAN